jgi:GntR family transcriptional regulator, transcriptional repressor for pyruvate dehydrogenase complex
MSSSRGSRKEDIVTEIKREILLQRYAPGDVLPREEALSEGYGVSRAVIREALGVLKAQGYLESRRGKHGGTFVTDVIESSALGDLFGDLILMGKMKIDDLLNARLLIEPEAARLAAMHLSPLDLQRLVDLHGLADSLQATLDRVRHNARFHILLGQLSGNPFYDVSIRSFMKFTVMFTEMLGDATPYVHDDAAHQGIIEALYARNPQLVYERMYVHVSGLKGAMVSQERMLRQANLG